MPEKFFSMKRGRVAQNLAVLAGMLCLILFGTYIKKQESVSVMADVETMDKKIAITFDDGPHPQYTVLFLYFPYY